MVAVLPATTCVRHGKYWQVLKPLFQPSCRSKKYRQIDRSQNAKISDLFPSLYYFWGCIWNYVFGTGFSGTLGNWKSGKWPKRSLEAACVMTG